ncbi:hypothetical protein [Methylosinus sp. LW4]|uniref:hypothetical protein n=1 Tax=Methylosinus sp. LW4 TaxID=136993 RepID=UPI0012FB5C51|nr:hypothetical protein [Methylosinus sp. LW4]
MTIVDAYTKVIHENFRPFFANWEPGRPVEIGDYGLMHGVTFLHLGNVRDQGVNFEQREDTRSDRMTFSSEGSTDIKLHAKGTAYAKARMEVTFRGNDAVFFNAAGCRHRQVTDKPALGRQIMQMYRATSWKLSWVVVTDLVRAGSTTVAISGGDNSSLILEGSAEQPLIDLADASAKVQLLSQSNIGFQLVAEEGLVPLIGVCKIQSPFPGFPKDFKPITLGRSADAENATDQDSLFFGQLY